ncbi:MAG: DUF1697 domain-containing protein [Geodermatophilaceae bacterium]|nr:DUF1697 domain-containing protein [Geodermatophilaceae bacterium]
MAGYIALLRGINVGRNKRIKMARLRELLTDLGYADVRTMLQSGNAVFTSTRRSAVVVGAEIEEAITSELGMDVTVLVRTEAQFAAAVHANPLAAAGRDPSRLLVLFLSDVPKASAMPAPENAAPEEWHVGGREIYLWCPNGILESALVPLFGDEHLGVRVTARNWRTVCKISESMTAGR